MVICKVVKEEVKRLVEEGLIPKEHNKQAMYSLERELRRRTNRIVTDIARKVSAMYLLRSLG